MVRKLVFTKLILIVFVNFCSQNTTAQEYKNNAIPLDSLLNKISNKHKIFFTYSANILVDKTIQEKGFTNLNLKESISLLQKLTPFSFDDLGNSYYVVFKKNRDTENSLNYTKILIDSSYRYDRIKVKGIVLSSDNIPLSGATLKDDKSLFGTTTGKDGTFQFEIQKKNSIVVSFLGHKTKTIQLTSKMFHTIILISGQELDEVKIVGSRNKNRVANEP